jgi:CBS domain-containing protein
LPFPSWLGIAPHHERAGPVACPQANKHIAFERRPNLAFINRSSAWLDFDQGGNMGAPLLRRIHGRPDQLNPPAGATPLFAINAVSLDTETTGLDPANARIVQIGVIDISNGELKSETAWEQIVDPGTPIPDVASKIHGISDADVSGSPDLATLWPELTERLGGRVVIGHSIGFDLSVLHAEARRAGLDWQKPRALCVRMLAMLVAPSLADHSLDALANWLDIGIENRHRALGDAVATAAVFTALLPRLKSAGISTLAQAERACLGLSPEVLRHDQAGWEMPVVRPGTRRQVPGARLDSYAYRHLVGDIMQTPIFVMDGAATLKMAMDEMTRLGISSVFVADPAEPCLPADQYGILTERDVTRRISAGGTLAFDLEIGGIAKRPVATIRQSAFIYRAAGRMARLKYRHLGVRDDHDRMVGIVSARDLLRARTNPAILLDDTIEEAATPSELAKAWSNLPSVVEELLIDEVDPVLVCQIVSEEIRAMTRRACILAEKSLEEAGRGPPPCPYTVLVLGSGGRGESMLVPDQDNAILFELGEPGSAQDIWFSELGHHLSATLDAAGIPFCKGGVMGMNEAWRGSAKTWRDRIDEWVSRSRPEDLLNVDIFYDANAVYGSASLADEITTYAFERGHQNAVFAKLLGENLASMSSPFSMFGGFRSQANALDLKMHILFPVTTLARILAIRHNIVRQSTRERLKELSALGIGSEGEFAKLLAAQRLAFELVLDQQSQDIERGIKPGNSIDLSKLNRARRRLLKIALGNVQDIPQIARDLMFAKPSAAQSATD